MGKFLTRASISILLGISVYLYVQVVNLQRVNAQLAASVMRINALQAENSRLKTQLAQQVASTRNESSDDWLDMARSHVQAAEQAATRGDFAQAADESRQASDTLSLAARNAGQRSRDAAMALHARLASIQTRAKTFWQSVGG